jgi:hypothetical protein
MHLQDEKISKPLFSDFGFGFWAGAMPQDRIETGLS